MICPDYTLFMSLRIGLAFTRIDLKFEMSLLMSRHFILQVVTVRQRSFTERLKLLFSLMQL